MSFPNSFNPQQNGVPYRASYAVSGQGTAPQLGTGGTPSYLPSAGGGTGDTFQQIYDVQNIINQMTADTNSFLQNAPVAGGMYDTSGVTGSTVGSTGSISNKWYTLPSGAAQMFAQTGNGTAPYLPPTTGAYSSTGYGTTGTYGTTGATGSAALDATGNPVASSPSTIAGPGKYDSDGNPVVPTDGVAPTNYGGIPTQVLPNGVLKFTQSGTPGNADDQGKPSYGIPVNPKIQQGPKGEPVWQVKMADGSEPLVYSAVDPNGNGKQMVLMFLDSKSQNAAAKNYSKIELDAADAPKDNAAMYTVIDKNIDTIHELVGKDSKQVITKEDWDAIGNGDKDTDLATLIPDENQRNALKQTARKMGQEVGDAQTKFKTPTEALKVLDKDDKLFKMANPGEKNKTRDMFEKIANGWTPEGLSPEDAAEFENLRAACQYTLTKKLNNPAAKENTLFDYLDNFNGSNDGDGKFSMHHNLMAKNKGHSNYFDASHELDSDDAWDKA